MLQPSLCPLPGYGPPPAMTLFCLAWHSATHTTFCIVLLRIT